MEDVRLNEWRFECLWLIEYVKNGGYDDYDNVKLYIQKFRMERLRGGGEVFKPKGMKD